MRKNLVPGKEGRIAQIEFNSFQHGTVQDPPASEISSSLADSTNLTIYPKYVEGRTGCKEYGTPLGAIADRTGYVAHKEGINIVSDSGPIFSHGDVGQYFNFGTYSELITAYIDDSHIVGSNSIYQSGGNCGIVGMPNAFMFHGTLRKWFIVAAGEVRFASVSMPRWNSITCISKTSPGKTKCDCSPLKNKFIIFTSNGMFKCEANRAFPILYKMNIGPPEVKLEGTPTFNDATCSYRYLYSATRIGYDGILVDRQSNGGNIDIDLETGTNLPDSTDVDYAEVFTEYGVSVLHPYVLRTLYLPKLPDSSEYQSHLTHFTIWRTESLEAKDIDDVNKERFNDPNRFTWVKDLRVCGAFYGSLTGSIFTATIGEFEVSDTYCVLELEDGQRFEILSVIDSKNVTIDIGYYTGGDIGPSAAAIGNGRVIKGSVTNGVLTMMDGSAFTSFDVGKTIFSAEGMKLIITNFINSFSVRVHANINQSVQGYTIDATHRQFYDTIDDTMLHARKDFYTCRSRYRRPLPDSNVGAIITGFVVTAIRGSSKIFYSHLESEYSQLMGQYIPNMQTAEEVKDNIQMFWTFESILAVICTTSTWGVTIGISEFATLPSSTESIALMAGFKLIDKNRGCLDIDSASEVENGSIMLVTNEPGGEALRIFNGVSYSAENYLTDQALGGRIVKRFQKTIKKSIAIYDGHLGYVLWRKKNELQGF